MEQRKFRNRSVAVLSAIASPAHPQVLTPVTQVRPLAADYDVTIETLTASFLPTVSGSGKIIIRTFGKPCSSISIDDQEVIGSYDPTKDYLMIPFSGIEGSAFDLKVAFQPSPCLITSNPTSKEEAAFTLFPNPAKDNVILSILEPTDLTISDLHGRIVMKRPLEPGEQMLDISAFEKGVYIFQMSNDANTQTVRLVVQ